MSAQVEEKKQTKPAAVENNSAATEAVDGKVEMPKGKWTLETTMGMGCLLVCESEEWRDFLSLCKDSIIDVLMKTNYYQSTARSQRRKEIEQDLLGFKDSSTDFFSFFEAILSDFDDRMQVVGCPEDNRIDHPVFLRHNYGATTKVIQMGPLSVKKASTSNPAHFTKEITYPVQKIEAPVSCYPSIPGPLDLTKDHKELMERDFDKLEITLNFIVAEERRHLLNINAEFTAVEQDKLDKLKKIHFSLQPVWQSYENIVIDQ